MPATDSTPKEIETRIRRLEALIKNFRDGRRRLEQLYSCAEGTSRSQIEAVLAINQGAIEARQRDLEIERERLLQARLTPNT
jgi:hypothetical protein